MMIPSPPCNGAICGAAKLASRAGRERRPIGPVHEALKLRLASVREYSRDCGIEREQSDDRGK